MTIPELFATPDQRARFAAMRVYADTFDTFAERQQGYRSTLPDLADELSHVAFLFLRAYTAEMRDPPVSRAPSCACVSCWAYRLIPSEAKAPHPSELPVGERRARREP